MADLPSNDRRILTAKERVLTACLFKRPDRIPRFDHFWDTPPDWIGDIGGSDAITDIKIWVPIEGAFASRARTLEKKGLDHIYVDQWGATVRTRRGAAFFETLAVPIPFGADIDRIQFDSPDLDVRYLRGKNTSGEVDTLLKQDGQKFCIFGKTGGPYLRTAFVRGTEQFLMDIASDPPLAKALSDKMAAHLAAVGVEQLTRWDLRDTGIWIYDDMANNRGPMFSPKSFEQIFLPGYQHMIRAFKEAGARYVFLHSDGNVNPILDMLVDAGIDGLNPIEPRAGMDAVELRKKYPRLILVGGMDNTETFIHGPIHRIESDAKTLIDLGREGGLVIGTHSISPETPREHVLAYHRVCQTYGEFTN
jgi:uroporphyrinogen decarboxylase